MVSPQETSVMVSIEEILRDARRRDEQARVDAERRIHEEAQRREEDRRRREQVEVARLLAEDEERRRRTFEERRSQAELEASQEAIVQRARVEAEARARTQEASAKREHELRLRALGEDRQRRRLIRVVVALLGAVAIGAAGAGVAIHRANDEAASARDRVRELNEKNDALDRGQGRLRAELEEAKRRNAAPPSEASVDAPPPLRRDAPVGPVPPATGHGSHKPPVREPAVPSCAPGDPLCATVP
jgi:hypothetical protein